VSVPDESDKQALRLAYESEVLSLVGDALTLGGQPSIEDLGRIGHLEELVKRLEISLVTALIEDGATWQQMATARGGTSRQNLNYRLSRTCLKWRADHVPGSASSVSLTPDAYLPQQYRLIRRRVKFIGGRHSDLQAAVRGSVQTFLGRVLEDDWTDDD
jgi:CelD/BcsL family acetyltransferase involved in cellulose biosynthesis